ncbi:MAG: hypothetical protein IKT68_03720 [Clostridia bacterium]|nr:hypothetical protein [Clostridia bacterium]
MKQILDQNAFQVFPSQNGFIFAVKEEREGKAVVSYKLLDFERLTLSPITRNVYLLEKFGQHFERYADNPEEFLQLRTLFVPDHRLLTVDPMGNARVYHGDGTVSWQGRLLYNDCPPTGFALDENGLYVSFGEAGAIVRYHARTLRPEMRFGGGNGCLPCPEGLYCQHESVYFCAPKEQKIYQLNPREFTVEEYAAFDQPVHQYYKYHANEIVRLDSGVYKL